MKICRGGRNLALFYVLIISKGMQAVKLCFNAILVNSYVSTAKSSAVLPSYLIWCK